MLIKEQQLRGYVQDILRRAGASEEEAEIVSEELVQSNLLGVDSHGILRIPQYMWQIEDLIRANGCDMEKIKSTIIASYPLTEEQKAELTQWYMDLIEMMRHEGIMEKGHLQINKNIITWLTDLHLQLLRSPKFPYYNSAYYKVLPYIVELRAKGADKEEPELETCFEALYGILLLKLQKKEISEETRKAQEAISTLLAMLSNYYIEDKKGELEF